MLKIKKLCSWILGVIMIAGSIPYTFAAAAESGFNEIQLESSYTDDFTLPGGVEWSSSDPTAILTVGSQAVVAPGLMEKKVTLTAKDGVDTKDFQITVPAGTVAQDDYLVNEDFEGVEVGKVPAGTLQKDNFTWWRQLGANVVSDDTVAGLSGKFGVCEETGNPSNKVYAIDANDRYTFLDFNGATADVPTVMDYRIKKKAVVNYANVWVTCTQGVKNGNKVVALLPGATTMIAQTKVGNTPVAAADDTWISVRFIIDIKNNKAQIYLLENGSYTLKVDDKPSRLDAPKQMMFGTDSDKALEELQLDDIKFYPDKWSVVGNELKFSEDLTQVTEDLTLPAENGTDVTWYTSDDSVVKSDGSIIRGDEEKTAALYAVAVRNGYKSIRAFDVTVAPDSEAVNQLKNLSITFAQGDTAQSVSKDFELPAEIVTTGGARFPISWTSDKQNSVALAESEKPGVVQAVVAKSYINPRVKLTACITEDGLKYSHDYTITVAKDTLEENAYYINEDFEGVATVGMLPGEEEQSGDVWQREGSKAAADFALGNGFLGMYLDGDNKVLKVSRDPVAGSFAQNYLVYAAADALPQPAAGSTADLVVEYDYNLKSIKGNNAMVWMTAWNGAKLGGQYMRASLRNNQLEAGFPVEGVANENWHNVAMSATVSDDLEKRALALYVDDEFQGKGGAELLYNGTNASAYFKNICFGFDSANTNGGELLVDNVKLYPNVWRPLQEVNVTEEVFGGNTVIAKDSVTLPATVAGYQTTWLTADSSLVQPDGTVHQPAEGSKAATVYAVLESNGVRAIHPVTLEILAPLSDAEAVQWDAEELRLEKVQKTDIAAMSRTTGTYLSTFEWYSSNEAAVSKDGRVTRTAEDQWVTVTAVVKRGEEKVKKAFSILVPAAGTDAKTITSAYTSTIRKNNATRTNTGNLVLDKKGDVNNQRQGFLKLSVEDSQVEGYNVRYLLQLTRHIDGESSQFEVYGIPQEKHAALKPEGIIFTEAEEAGLVNLPEECLIALSTKCNKNETVTIDVTEFILVQKKLPEYQGEVAFKVANTTTEPYQILGAGSGPGKAPALVIERTYDEKAPQVVFTNAAGGEISKLEEGAVRAAVNLSHLEDRENLTLYAALYKDGILEQCETLPDQKIVDGVYCGEISMEVPDPAGRSLAVFLWDDHLAPVMQAAELPGE